MDTLYFASAVHVTTASVSSSSTAEYSWRLLTVNYDSVLYEHIIYFVVIYNLQTTYWTWRGHGLIVQEHRVRVTLLSRSTAYRRILNENEVCIDLLFIARLAL